MQNRVVAMANSLSERCLTCKAACCKAGRILLSEQNALLFARKEVLGNGDIVVSLVGGCEHLKNDQCAIYTKRPQVCKDFPLFLRHHTLFVASFCPATAHLSVELEKLQEEFPQLRVVFQ